MKDKIESKKKIENISLDNPKLVGDVSLLLSEGKSPLHIMKEFSITHAQFVEISQYIFQIERKEVLKNEVDVYVQYKKEQAVLLDKIENVFTDLSDSDDKNKFQSMLQAIRLKSDIIERIINKGQELNVVGKYTGDRGEMSKYNDMTVEELNKEILREQAEFVKIVEYSNQEKYRGLKNAKNINEMNKAITNSLSNPDLLEPEDEDLESDVDGVRVNTMLSDVDIE